MAEVGSDHILEVLESPARGISVDVLIPENSDADLICANLESTIYEAVDSGRDQIKGQPARMNASEAMLKKFRDKADINLRGNNDKYDLAIWK